MGGVPFSLLAWIPWEARIAHRFHPKFQKSAQNGGTPFFDPTFGNLAGFWGYPRVDLVGPRPFFPLWTILGGKTPHF